MAVLDPADGGFAAAYLVFHGPAAVLERMNRVVLQQDIERAEYRGLIHGLQLRLQLRHGDRVGKLREFLEYENAGRGRVDAVVLKLLFDGSVCHSSVEFELGMQIYEQFLINAQNFRAKPLMRVRYSDGCPFRPHCRGV